MCSWILTFLSKKVFLQKNIRFHMHVSVGKNLVFKCIRKVKRRTPFYFLVFEIKQVACSAILANSRIYSKSLIQRNGFRILQTHCTKFKYSSACWGVLILPRSFCIVFAAVFLISNLKLWQIEQFCISFMTRQFFRVYKFTKLCMILTFLLAFLN